MYKTNNNTMDADEYWYFVLSFHYRDIIPSFALFSLSIVSYEIRGDSATFVFYQSQFDIILLKRSERKKKSIDQGFNCFEINLRDVDSVSIPPYGAYA